MKTLHTIGYEGALIADFVATLRVAAVDVLIDVRDLPVSRKPGFSKRALSEQLGAAGIEYVHLRDLGDPKPGRDAARKGDFGRFERIFREHLAREQSQIALSEAIDIASALKACLLCFERDHARCHRTIVAEAMTDLQTFMVRHLEVRRGLASLSRTSHDALYGEIAVG